MLKKLFFGTVFVFLSSIQLSYALGIKPLDDEPLMLERDVSGVKIWYGQRAVLPLIADCIELQENEKSGHLTVIKTHAVFDGFKKRISGSILCKHPKIAHSFVVQIAFDELVVSSKNKKNPSVDVRIYGTSEKLSLAIYDFVQKSLSQKMSCVKKVALGIGVVAAGSVVGYAITSTPDKDVVRDELRDYVEHQWKNSEHFVRHYGTGTPNVVVFEAHGYMGDCKVLPQELNDPIDPEDKKHKWPYIRVRPAFDSRRRVHSFAQDNDAYQLALHLQKTIDFFPDVPILCIGTSNGASSMISMLCNEKDGLAKKIAGVILKAPFSDVSETGFFSWIPFQKVRRYLGRRGAKYSCALGCDVNQPSIDERVARGDFPENLKVLLLHAKDDWMVPFRSYQLLESLLSKHCSGFKGFFLDTGGHELIDKRFNQEIDRFLDTILLS